MTTDKKKLGLSEHEARERLAKFGRNELKVVAATPGWVRFFIAFKNPLVLILLGAALLSGIFGELKSAILIAVIVVASTLLNFYQEQKSGVEAEKLKDKLALTATVVRDGVSKEVRTAQLVPGDTVLVSVGEIIPADCEVISAEDLFVNESVLTGESFPVEKMFLESVKNTKGAKHNLVFAGTVVVSGSGVLQVTQTGQKTAFGAIAESVEQTPPPTAFERGINSFGFLIIKSTVFIVLTVFLIVVFKPLLHGGALSKHALIQSFLFALAIAVGLTPELLPMIMSINMAKGSIRMARKGVIVKRLNAIPDFGSIDVLCTDKTGTLTEDRITLVKYLDWKGEQSEDVLKYAYINSSFQTGLKNPLDAAVKAAKHIPLNHLKKVGEIPYDFERKRLSVVVGESNEHVMITKGQPEEVFKICTHIKEGEVVRVWGKVEREALNKIYDDLSQDGFKTLAVSFKKIKNQAEKYTPSEENEMTFLGLIGFYDPPKKTAGATLKELQRQGVEVKIITGDNELVTQKICRDLGLMVKGTLNGDQMVHLTREALAAKAGEITIFARFNPEQKRRVIAALRLRGHVVGYLGDGINDSPSLKAADIGISVSNAVDVAKASADIILSHKSLRELGDGIVEGRKTFGNTIKYLMMGLSSNFGNMFSLIAAAIYLPYLPILPYQVLLNNTLYDLSQTTIPSDRVDSDYLEKPKKWDVRFMRRFMILFGLASSVFDVVTFYFLYRHFNLPAAAFQTGWFLESIATQTLVIYIIRTKKPFWQSRPSGFLAATTLAVVLTAFALPYTMLGSYFSFVPLPLPVLGAILAIVMVYLCVVEVMKQLFYRYGVSGITTV